MMDYEVDSCGGSSEMTVFKRILKITGIVLASVLTLCIISLASIMIYLDVITPETITPLGEYVSSDGKHTLSAYQSSTIFINPTYTIVTVSGSWIIGKRTIYKVNQTEDIVAVWIDDHTVNVNGAIMNIYFDQYSGHIEDPEY